MTSQRGSPRYASYIACLPAFEIYQSNMGVTGSKGELRGVKGSYIRHTAYDVIGRLPTKEGGSSNLRIYSMSVTGVSGI